MASPAPHGLLLDQIPGRHDFSGPAVIHIGGGQVVQGFVHPVVIVVIHKPADLMFQFPWEVVILLVDPRSLGVR